MSDAIHSTGASRWRSIDELPFLRVRLARRIQRLRRAWHYAANRLTGDDARKLFLECRDPAGWHPLDLLTAEDITEEARDIFRDHPDLPKLIAKACRLTGYRWHSYENIQKARAIALDLIEQFAAEDGIVLFTLQRPEAPPAAAAAPFAPKRLAAPKAPRLTYQSPNGKPARTASIFDHAAARAEGWDLVKAGDFSDGSPNMTIQHTTWNNKERLKFPDDPSAWTLVVMRARAKAHPFTFKPSA